MRLGEKHKYSTKESGKCDADAEYYLSNNNYDFNTALAEYKADIQKELEDAKERYDERKKNKGKKKRKGGKKVGDGGGIRGEGAIEEPEH